jgi:hypothetical protein
MRRVDARFCDKRGFENLQKLREPKKIKWLMEVYFAVSLRAEVVDGDVMNMSWNAMTPKRCRDRWQ